MSSMDTTREYGENSLPEDVSLIDVVDLSTIEIESKGEDAVIRITK